jgi:polar amino acid transport system substrate-binding protein
MRRRSATLILLALCLLAGACVPPPPEESLERSYGDTTTMGKLQAAGRVRIGVTADSPPLGYVDPQTEEAAGFTVALGREVAGTLGVQVDFTLGPPDRLLELVARDELDIAFPNLPLTEEAVRSHAFSTPYLLVHQRLLVPSSSDVTAVEELAGRRVCAAISRRTEISPEAIEPRVQVVGAESLGDCLPLFRRGAVAAITAPDVYLHHAVNELGRCVPAKIVGDELSAEGYGAVVSPGGGWLPFVNAVLEAAEVDGTWADGYRRWIAARPGEPPGLSAEEAAALFPSTGDQ